MRTFLIVFGTIVLALALIVAGLVGGLFLTRGIWGPRMAATWGSMMPWRSTGAGGAAWASMPCGGTGGVACGPGTSGSPMMRGGGGGVAPCGATGGACGQGLAQPPVPGGRWGAMPCTAGGGACGGLSASPGITGTLTLEQARTAVEQYLGRAGYDNLEVQEVMEFAYNDYAIAVEKDTGIGAMELLVNKETGAVGPEHGPNMMWNARYGMMGRRGMGMMGRFASEEMTLSPEEAKATAQRWLDANLPGRTAGEADPFYGYYTFHFLKDGEVEGMLSVHGSSGQVWYHNWHGDFIGMIGEEEG